jgi:preprotein translocase subunit YajC
VQLLALFFTENIQKSNLAAQITENPEAAKHFIEKYGQDGIQVYVDVYYATIQQAYTYLAFVFMVLPFGFFLWAFSRRQRKQFNLAETCVFSLYTVGHLVLVTGLLVFVTVHFGTALHGILSITLYFAYTFFAARGFYDRQHLNHFTSFFSLVFAFVLFILSIGTAFAIFQALELK